MRFIPIIFGLFGILITGFLLNHFKEFSATTLGTVIGLLIMVSFGFFIYFGAVYDSYSKNERSVKDG